MRDFNFKSSVCTDKNQSERLLALGLKKETADMCWIPLSDGRCVLGLSTEIRLDIIPAWSLHRLLEIWDSHIAVFDCKRNPYNRLIDEIEECLKKGFIDTRYLEEWCLNEEE